MPRSTSSDRVCCPRAVMHATPDIADRVCCPREVMSSHARRRAKVCAVQGRLCHATLDVVQPCVLPNGDDIMSHPMSFDRVCCPKAMMACHTRRRLTVCAVQ